MEVFDSFDDDGSGLLSGAEFSRVVKALGVMLTGRELEELCTHEFGGGEDITFEVGGPGKKERERERERSDGRRALRETDLLALPPRNLTVDI